MQERFSNLQTIRDRQKVTEKVINNGLNKRKQTEKLIEEVLLKEEEAIERKQDKINISYKIYLNTHSGKLSAR